MLQWVDPHTPVGLAQGTVYEAPDHTHTDSFACRMYRDDAVEMDALAILLGHHLKLGMLHAETLSTKSWLSIDDEARAGHNALLHMEEIEPAERDSRGEHGAFNLFDLGLETAHSSKAAKGCLAHSPAETEGTIAFRIREMIKAFPILMASWVMLQ